jgi:hypothetical protein
LTVSSSKSAYGQFPAQILHVSSFLLQIIILTLPYSNSAYWQLPAHFCIKTQFPVPNLRVDSFLLKLDVFAVSCSKFLY